MRKSYKVLAVWCLLAALMPSVATSVSGQTIESVSFKTNFIPRTHEQLTQLTAKLYLPQAAGKPHGAVVIIPASVGVRAERELYYAEELATAGLAALVIDSNASRGLTESTYDQSLLSHWNTANDAIAGLRWLIADGRFKRGRIGVMGVAKGGMTAMYTALDVRRRWMRLLDVAFAAHIPIVPDCITEHRTMRTSGAPMFFMLAELDDQALPGPCVEFAGKLRAAGNPNIEVKVYKGAYHAWERLSDRPIFDPQARNRTRCPKFTLEDDGSLTGADGTRLPAFGVGEWQLKNCVRLGASCCGGTAELKRQATNDLIAFLKAHGF